MLTIHTRSGALFVLGLLLLSVFAPDTIQASEKQYPEQNWGLGMIMRGATIPFATDETRVSSMVPMMWYDGDHVFFQGTEGGVRFYEKDRWRLSAFGRLHFFDIPSELQNEYQGDTVDGGIQARYRILGPIFTDLELMTDFEGNSYANIRLGSYWRGNTFSFFPYAELKLKNKQYNSYYFGLDQESISGGGDLSLGFTGTYRFVSNFYMYGAAKITLLDRQVRKSQFINKDALGEVYLGLGLSNDRSKPLKPVIDDTPYWRLAHGWATPSSLAEIFHGVAEDDQYNNQMTSLFYAQPLTDNMLGLPIHLFASLGFVWHHKSEVQDHAQEVVATIKMYYTIPLPVRLRVGAAEGVSYVNTIPYVEETQVGNKGYKTSKLLNFLDFSADINLGDITGGSTMKHWWLGYSIHHRSAIFESVQHFGRISGGSNIQSVYLQWHY